MPATRVAIIDCGGANIASLTNALDRLQIDRVLTTDASTIEKSSHVILPGVGAAANTMQRLAAKNLLDVIVNLRQPVLGICLGMHLLAQSSEEDDAQCLGVVATVAKRLPVRPQKPVPNMGWCRVRQDTAHELFAGIEDGSYFYFVHSFALATGDYTLATAEHVMSFTAVLAQDNFFATQFHPERSARPGARLLNNFLKLGT